MKKGFYYILVSLSVILLWSCSTKKNTKTSRFYHALNTRYNIYYNGKVSFDEALQALQDGYKENYSEPIFMYPISAQPKDKQTTGGPFDRAIEKGHKGIKLHSIKTKPPKKPGWRNNPKQRALQEQEEYNPFLKHCWLMIGQSQFYNADFLQASATFSYIVRHYAQDEEVMAEARLWQARCYSEMGWFYESEDILGKLNTNGIPRKKLKLYASVYADYLIKERRHEEAIPYLQTAIKAEKNRKQRIRMKYLLGQLYADLGLDALAYKAFGDVAKSYPPYELEFAARIRQTEVFTGNKYQQVIRMLQGMAKNQKNKDYQDQVYYALGNVYLSREDTLNAVKNYQLGIDKSTLNGMDKAICQIRLGDIYFEQHDYVKAQPCFSGALAGIKKEYKDYTRVAKLSAVLDELVVHVEAVHLQDSLQTLAKLPEAERLAVIDQLIEKVIKEEEEAKALAEKEAYLADQQSKGTGIDRPGTETGGIVLPTSAGGSSFYFYNPPAVSQGKTQFQRKWGRRPLEDDWRRRKKALSTFNESPDDKTVADSDSIPQVSPDGLPLDADSVDLESVVASDDPKTREFYIQQLPFTQEDVDASNLIILDGLYQMAMIYKDKLEDIPLSVQAFEELEKRFPDHSHSLESYYQVYLMALRTRDPALAAEYKTKLTARFPESDYAVAIADPNYEYNIRMMDRVQDSIYQQTYHRYLAEDTVAVRRSYELMATRYPLAGLMPKFMFLEALSYVQAGDPEGFKRSLKALVEKYPAADVSELAGEMLKGVLRGRSMVQGGMKGMAWNLRFGVGDDGLLSAADSARQFVADTAGMALPYRMLLVYPTGSVDKNQLLFAVAAYNFANFMVKEFDLSVEEAGPVSMLMVQGFVNFEEILQYYKMIYGKDGYGKALDKQVAILPVSDDNYETLMRGKTLDEYVLFFEENYGERAPELVARWKARMEAAEAEEEPVLVEPAEVVEEAVVLQPLIPDVAEPVIPAPAVDLVIPQDLIEKKDTVPAVQAPAEEQGMSLKEIEAIRKREAHAQDSLVKRQKAEEEVLLKAKVEQEKQLERSQKEKAKQAEADRQAKLKAREAVRKEKERVYKERLKQKEKERKAKEREYAETLKKKEKARREAQKAKQAASRKP